MSFHSTYSAFSKKFESHCHAIALYFVWYNFIKFHKTLRMTPAMAAGITDKVMDMSDVVALIAANESGPTKRGPYKKNFYRSMKIERLLILPWAAFAA